LGRGVTTGVVAGGGTVGTGDGRSVVVGEETTLSAGARGNMVGLGIMVSVGIGVVVGLVWVRDGDGSDVDVAILGSVGVVVLVSTGNAGVSSGGIPATMVCAAEVKISSWGVKTPAGGCSKAWQEFSSRLYKRITSPDSNI
jgi:hypothetical protein